MGLKINPMPPPKPKVKPESKQPEKPCTVMVYDHATGIFYVIKGEVVAKAPIVSERFSDWAHSKFEKDALWLIHTKGVDRLG